MEKNIILPHELLQFNPIFGSGPPQLICIPQVVSSDGQIAKYSFKPNIEYFLLVIWKWHWDSPLKITSDATIPQSTGNHCCGHSFRIIAPSPHGVPCQPLLQCPLQIVELEKKMSCGCGDRCTAAYLALRIDQLLDWVSDDYPTAITLIPVRVFSTFPAHAMHKPIGQKQIALLTFKLRYSVFLDVSIVMHAGEYLLCDTSMHILAGSPEVIEGNIKPVIYLFMDLKVFVTDFLRATLIFQCFDLCCCPVLIRTTQIQHIVPPQSTVTSIHICRQYSSDYIPQMWSVVHIWQC